MVGLAVARDPMMRHARPPVNKREKTRVATPLDGPARPAADRRRFGYTGPGAPLPTPRRALHQVFTCDVKVRARTRPAARVPSPLAMFTSGPGRRPRRSRWAW